MKWPFLSPAPKRVPSIPGGVTAACQRAREVPSCSSDNACVCLFICLHRLCFSPSLSLRSPLLPVRIHASSQPAEINLAFHNELRWHYICKQKSDIKNPALSQRGGGGVRCVCSAMTYWFENKYSVYIWQTWNTNEILILSLLAICDRITCMET